MCSKISKIFMVLAVTVSLFVFSSCDKSDQEEVLKEIPEYLPLTDIQEGKKDIYLIVKNLESSYWKVIIQGVADAGKAMDCNVYYSGTASETDWDVQSELLDIAVRNGAAAIILAPDDSVNLAPKVNEVYSKGVPVVLTDTVVNTQNYSMCYMTDNLMAGKQAAAEMIDALKRKGVNESEDIKIAIQVGSTSSQTIPERLAGFCKYWTKYAPEKWKIIDDVKCNDGNIDKAVLCARDFFTEYSDIKAVFGTNNGATVGFARYILENELTDVTIVGFDFSDEMKQLVNDNRYNASTMLQRQYDMGYRGLVTALDIINGADYDVKFIDTGVVAVNGENLNNPEIIKLIENNQ